MKNRIISIISWVIVLWTSKVFLFSLPYKFSGHPDTQHIFGTIGAVFFHLFTPLGVEVLHEGKSDHGSLFFAALSILILGSMLFILNFITWQASRKISL